MNTWGGYAMSLEYTEPAVEQMYNNLSKLDLKSLTPEQSSATWEIINKLYKEERRKRRRTIFIRLGAALSTTLLIGSTFLLIRRMSAKTNE